MPNSNNVDLKDFGRLQLVGYEDQSQINDYAGLSRELVVDLANKTLRVHDGDKRGGYALASAAQLDSKESLSNKVDSWSGLDGQPSAHDKYLSVQGSLNLANQTLSSAQASSPNWVSVTMASFQFTESSSYEGWPWEASLTLDDANHDGALVNFSPEDAVSGVFAPFCVTERLNSTQLKLTIYANQQVMANANPVDICLL